ncbi:MAG: alginate export family protein [bacterium]
MKKILTGLLSFIFIIGLTGVCSAEDAAEKKLSYGGDIRIRGQVLTNNKDLFNDKYDDEQYYTHRTRLWVKGEFEEGYTAYVRLAIEPRWGHPDTAYNDSTTDSDGKAAPEIGNHLVIDNSYIEAKKFLGIPVTLKIGRQDMSYGEGFLVQDGTDGTNFSDGSRTGYFDAIKLTSDFGIIGVDLFTAKADEGAYNNQDDEDLYGLYVTIKALKDHTFDVYGLRRDQKAYNYHKGLADSSITKSYTNAIGVRATGIIVENLSYGAELVGEFGKIDKADGIDRAAMGGLAHLTYAMPQAPTQPSITLGVYYTSGDKEDTADKNEGWDGFYSDFPKYGYGDVLANMGKIDPDEGVWANHTIYEVDIKATPLPNLTTSLGYLYLMASEQNDARSKVRGKCPQAKLEYRFTKAVSGRLIGQYFQAGDYYRGQLPYGKNDEAKNYLDAEANDDALWGRAELNIKF